MGKSQQGREPTCSTRILIVEDDPCLGDLLVLSGEMALNTLQTDVLLQSVAELLVSGAKDDPGTEKAFSHLTSHQENRPLG